MNRSQRQVLKALTVLALLAAVVPATALAYRLVFGEELTPAAVERRVGGTRTEPAPVGIATRTAPESRGDASSDGGQWVEYVVSDQNMAISIPAAWQRLPLNPAEVSGLLEGTRKQNPELAATLSANAEALVQGGVRFWAYDADPAATRSNFATTLTVLKRSLPNAMSLDAYAQANVNQVSALKSKVGAVNTERVTLRDLPAQRLQYTVAFARPDGASFLSAVTQYLALYNTDSYVIGFATAAESAERYGPVFQKSAASFRILPER